MAEMIPVKVIVLLFAQVRGVLSSVELEKMVKFPALPIAGSEIDTGDDDEGYYKCIVSKVVWSCIDESIHVLVEDDYGDNQAGLMSARENMMKHGFKEVQDKSQ